MTSPNSYPPSPQTLIQRLCRQGAGRRPQSRLHEVFPHLKRTPNFHCTSFFRSGKTPTPRCNSDTPFHFTDGRVYEVLDFKIVEGTNGEVSHRCCVDVIERQTSEFIPFEVWFYKSALGEDAGDENSFNESAYNEGSFDKKTFGGNTFDDRPLDEAAKRQMIEFTRQWIWEFLYTKRNAVDWSHYGYPYVCECR